MYVHTYVCMYDTYIRSRKYVCTRMCTSIRIHYKKINYMSVCIYIHTYVYTYVCMLCVCMYVRMGGLVRT
jgi:hypothetical protein